MHTVVRFMSEKQERKTVRSLLSVQTGHMDMRDEYMMEHVHEMCTARPYQGLSVQRGATFFEDKEQVVPPEETGFVDSRPSKLRRRR
jgi:hypothetical protein